MTKEQQAVLEAIRHRRSVFPGQYTGEPIDRSTIEQLLELANWAPTHRMTEPWRFKVFHGKGLEKLSDYMTDHYDENTPEDQRSEMKRNKMRKNPLRAGAVIAIILSRDAEERVPEWEELASVACAVQNMWIAASAIGLGAYWSTPAAALEARGFLDLEENERCLGWFYVGKIAEAAQDSRRTPVAHKTEWISG